MPVVISEFEVVPTAEPSKEPAPSPGARAPLPATTAASPREIEHVLCRIHERVMRVRAH